MLSPHELELLTAHVDSELSAAARRQVEGLLERSGEARDMLHWLEADASRLRGMSRRAVPVDLSAGVLEEIGRLAQRTNGRAKPASPLPRLLRFPVWGGVAAAAAVLLAVAAVSFLLNSPRGDPDKDPGGFAGKADEKDKGNFPAPDRGTVVKIGPDKDEGKAVAKVPDPDDKGKASPDKSTGKAKEPPSPSAILAANGGESQPNLERVELDLPTIARLHELDKPEAGKALTERLSKVRTARVELTTKDGLRAFDRLRAAMLARKIHLHIDPATVARLKKTLVKSDLVVFVENVKPEDVVELLREAGVADRKAGDPRFDGAVVVKELGRWDRKDLTDLLGLDPLVNRPVPRSKTGIDIRRELPEQTTREVVAALDGQGVPRPGVEAAHHAYVSHLPSSKGRPAELMRFLDLRQPPKAGTVQVLLLVLRQVG